MSETRSETHSETHNDPPYVAEQTGVVVHAAVSTDPLEGRVTGAKKETQTAAMGAVVTFEGTVRDHDNGSGVETLIYTHHPTASAVLAQIVEETVAAHPEVRIWAEHRSGVLKVGDLAFLVVVASAHRGPAFAALVELATRVKTEVPIWKEQEHTDGSTDWVGLER